MKYRYLDHTSDLGMEIFGRDLPDLFRNACFAVFDNIVNLEAIEARETSRIEISSTTLEELFLDWLRELLFRFSTQYFVVSEVSAIEIKVPHPTSPSPSPNGKGAGESVRSLKLSAELQGEKFDPARHRVKIEIKTPTYHMYRIERSPEGYTATIIFDV